jgi:hypothetical protein
MEGVHGADTIQVKLAQIVECGAFLVVEERELGCIGCLGDQAVPCFGREVAE